MRFVMNMELVPVLNVSPGGTRNFDMDESVNRAVL
jgi:hypothetical protein